MALLNLIVFRKNCFNQPTLIRHASYGYSGFFDQVKIQEAEFDRIYQYDLSLVTDVEALEASVKDPEQLGLANSERIASAWKPKFEDRKHLFTGTG